MREENAGGRNKGLNERAFLSRLPNNNNNNTTAKQGDTVSLSFGVMISFLVVQCGPFCRNDNNDTQQYLCGRG